jgi:hypothetical protein
LTSLPGYIALPPNFAASVGVYPTSGSPYPALPPTANGSAYFWQFPGGESNIARVQHFIGCIFYIMYIANGIDMQGANPGLRFWVINSVTMPTYY